MTSVPVHGTISKQMMKSPNGAMVEKAVLTLRGSMNEGAAQGDPGLVRNKFVGKDGKPHYGMSQICTTEQADKIMAAAGDQCVELHDKDGKPTGKYAVAFSANLIPNAAGTGLIPNTNQPMGTNPIAIAAGWKDEKSAMAFMSDQRLMAKCAGDMRKEAAKEAGNDLSTAKGREATPYVFDVSERMAQAKAEAAKTAEAAKEAPETPKAEKAAPAAKRSRRRKLPDAPAAEAPEAQAEEQAGMGE